MCGPGGGSTARAAAGKRAHLPWVKYKPQTGLYWVVDLVAGSTGTGADRLAKSAVLPGWTVRFMNIVTSAVDKLGFYLLACCVAFAPVPFGSNSDGFAGMLGLTLSAALLGTLAAPPPTPRPSACALPRWR